MPKQSANNTVAKFFCFDGTGVSIIKDQASLMVVYEDKYIKIPTLDFNIAKNIAKDKIGDK